MNIQEKENCMDFMVQEIWILWCKKYEISLALRSIDPKQL
jgi:predicted RNA-binding protein with PUA domain